MPVGREKEQGQDQDEEGDCEQENEQEKEWHQRPWPNHQAAAMPRAIISRCSGGNS